jgi:hypothetical protein
LFRITEQAHPRFCPSPQKIDLDRDLYSGFYATADNISNIIISGTHRRVPQINDASAAATAHHCFLPLICYWTSGGGWEGEDDVRLGVDDEDIEMRVCGFLRRRAVRMLPLSQLRIEYSTPMLALS